MRTRTVSKSGFRTKKEALEHLPALSLVAVDLPGKPARRNTAVTFGQLYDLWLPTHKASKSTLCKAVWMTAPRASAPCKI